MNERKNALINIMTPASVASSLLDAIKDIEDCIEKAGKNVKNIEERGVFDSIFSSTTTDLVSISKSQNKINDMILSLIQEVISLNTMSFSFLIAVVGELEDRTRKGWIDNEGKLQTLSTVGLDFADKARDIFLRIVEGAKGTQKRINLNAENIDEIRNALELRSKLGIQQGQEIEFLRRNQSIQAEKLSSIDELLCERNLFFEQQNRLINMIAGDAKSNFLLDREHIQALSEEFCSVRSQLASLENRSLTQNRQLRMGLLVLSTIILVLVATLLASMKGFI
jgi:hypothetical protein